MALGLLVAVVVAQLVGVQGCANFSGIGSTGRDARVCCAASCLVCDDATTCANRPGGASCCPALINVTCSATQTAPCIMPSALPLPLHSTTTATYWYFGGGLVSLVCCVAMVVSYSCGDRKHRKPPADLLKNRTLCDIGASVGHLLPIMNGSDFHTTDLCEVQAVFIQFFSIASLGWWVCFSMELLWSVRNPFTDHAAHLRYYNIGVWTLAVVSAVVLVTSREIGLTEFHFCWVKHQDGPEAVSFAVYYIPVAIGYIFSLSVLVWVKQVARVVIPASHKVRTIAITQGEWYIVLIGMYWTFSGIIWFGSFGGEGDLKLIVPMALSVAVRGVVALAVWLKTRQLAERMIKEDSNQRTSEGDIEMRESLMQSALPNEKESRESIPLKWALRRDVMLACQQGIDNMAEMTAELVQCLPKNYGLTSDDFKYVAVKQVERRDQDDVRFTFYDFAPLCFHVLRGGMGMTPSIYRSFFSYEDVDDAMMEKFSDGGRSGSFFYFTAGKEFIVKTVTPSECRLLLKLLPNYYTHLMENRDSLIVRFYGLHSIKMHAGAKRIYFVVMDNVFLTRRIIDEVYDIKGSWVDRGPTTPYEEQDVSSPTMQRTSSFFARSSKQATGSRVLKDLDIAGKKKVVVGTEVRDMLLRHVRKDCEFFTRNNIMDYSLLLGVNRGKFRDVRVPRADLAIDLTAPSESPQSPFRYRASRSSTYRPPTLAKGEGNETADTSTGLRTVDDPLDESSDCGTPTIGSIKRYLPFYRRDEGGIHTACTDEEQFNGDLMYFMGTIDILQSWDWGKKLERFMKTFFLHKDGQGLSAINPRQYSQRFVARCEELFE